MNEPQKTPNRIVIAEHLNREFAVTLSWPFSTYSAKRWLSSSEFKHVQQKLRLWIKSPKIPIIISFSEASILMTQVAIELLLKKELRIIRIQKQEFWYKLKTLTNVNTERTHGIGENPLHIDYINRSRPPSFIGFFCVREDPFGGGWTQLASLTEAALMLDDDCYRELSRPVFKYWADDTANKMGPLLEPFSVLPTDRRDLGKVWVRYSSKMLPHLNENSPVLIAEGAKDVKGIRECLIQFHKCLIRCRTIIPLQKGQFVLFSQKFHAHGRLAMGFSQKLIPGSKRRSLLQMYANGAKSSSDSNGN